MIRVWVAAILVAWATLGNAESDCLQVTDRVSVCGGGDNLAGSVGMETAFPNSKYVALSEDDWDYGFAIALIPVRLSGTGQLDAQTLTDVLIQNATSKLWVEANTSDIRFRNASAGGWGGVQAEYRIVGATERLGTNYVTDAYLIDDNTVIAFQSYTDADRSVTNALRAFHTQSMQKIRLTP